MMRAPSLALLLSFACGLAAALAQDANTPDPTPKGTLNPQPLPPLANPNSPSTPAKELFARKTEPLPGPARSIGFYATGCLAGGVALPITGPGWQVMRLSRNRNWGNPELIAFLERFGKDAKKIGWNGLLVGDMSQPRGGPMITGHASHQVGLDADIWFTPMPDHVLTREEREMDGAVNMVAPDRLDVDPKVWTHERTAAHPRRRAGSRGDAHIRQRRDQEGDVPRSGTRIANGCRRYGHGGVIPSISTSASPARLTARSASRNRRRGRATAAATSLTTGSRNRRCTQSRRRCRRNRSRR